MPSMWVHTSHHGNVGQEERHTTADVPMPKILLCYSARPLHCYQFALVYEGDGDDNAILRNWNSAVRFYKKHGWMSYGQWEKAPAWTDDPHVRDFTFG